MPDFEKLYYFILGQTETAIRLITEEGNSYKAANVLIDAQREAEEQFIESEPG